MNRRSFLKRFGVGAAAVAAAPVLVQAGKALGEMILMETTGDLSGQGIVQQITEGEWLCSESEAEAEAFYKLRQEMEYSMLFGQRPGRTPLNTMMEHIKSS